MCAAIEIAHHVLFRRISLVKLNRHLTLATSDRVARHRVVRIAQGVHVAIQYTRFIVAHSAVVGVIRITLDGPFNIDNFPSHLCTDRTTTCAFCGTGALLSSRRCVRQGHRVGRC